MLIAFFVAIMFACVAMLFSEGLWSNTITLINTVIAALIATNYFEPAGAFLAEQIPSFAYFCDFLALWLIFAVTAGILRAITEAVSKVQVKFRKPIESAGSTLMAVVIGMVMICFTAMSLHAAPLPLHSFGGTFQVTPDESIAGFGPDRIWIGFVHYLSDDGAYSRFDAPLAFDEPEEFILNQGARRAAYDAEPSLLVD